jgi:hypothetical protein
MKINSLFLSTRQGDELTKACDDEVAETIFRQETIFRLGKRGRGAFLRAEGALAR